MNTILLNYYLEYNFCLNLCVHNGEFEKVKIDRAKYQVSGNGALINQNVLAFYLDEKDLKLYWNKISYLFSDISGINLDLINKAVNATICFKSGEQILIQEQVTRTNIPVDFTPFVDQEDGSFLIFLKNIFEDKERQQVFKDVWSSGSMAAAAGSAKLVLDIGGEHDLSNKVPTGYLNATMGLIVKNTVTNKSVIMTTDVILNLSEGFYTANGVSIPITTV